MDLHRCRAGAACAWNALVHGNEVVARLLGDWLPGSWQQGCVRRGAPSVAFANVDAYRLRRRETLSITLRR